MRATFIGLLCSLTKLAVTDDRLDKPPLAGDLDYLKKGLLEYLHPVHSSHTKWGLKWIPEARKDMTEDANLTATDLEVFSVQYDDVGTGVDVHILWDYQTNMLLSLMSQGPLDPLPAQRQSRAYRNHDRPLRPGSSPRASMGPPRHQPT